MVVAVPERAPAHELLLVREEFHDPEGVWLPLVSGARVGTSAPRRRAQLAALRPDVDLMDLRGNVPTRVGRCQTGDYDPELPITRAGDRLMRKLLVQASQYILGHFGPDTDLHRWGDKLAARGGKNAKKRAIVATARKLSVLLHRLWMAGSDYEPLRHANRSKKAA